MGALKFKKREENHSRVLTIPNLVLKGALPRLFCCILVKTSQIFEEIFFANMKLLLEHREGRTNNNQFFAISLKYKGRI